MDIMAPAFHSPSTPMRYREEPDTTKASGSCENKYQYVGVSRMQGWRTKMEDFSTCVPDLAPDETGEPRAFYAVYDGHRGSSD